nr:unnamed protein product [Digitaria exilis]
MYTGQFVYCGRRTTPRFPSATDTAPRCPSATCCRSVGSPAASPLATSSTTSAVSDGCTTVTCCSTGSSRAPAATVPGNTSGDAHRSPGATDP